MQVLKEKVRQAIVMAATEEFYNHGYQKTAVASIAKEANVGLGNIYNYFKSKKEIFNYIVDPIFEDLKNLIYDRAGVTGVQLSQKDFITQLNSDLLSFLKMNHKLLHILFEQSAGTAFSNAKDEIISLINEKSLERNRHSTELERLSYSDAFTSLLTSTILVEGYLQIIKNYKDEQWFENVSSDFFRFYFTGLSTFVKQNAT